MLESVWETRKSDLLDLITPFVLYAIASKTAPGEIVDISYTTEYVRENYGYVDIPASVIKKILHRNAHNCFKKNYGSYKLIKPLDFYINEVDRKRNECENYITQVSTDLASYLNDHCLRSHDISAEKASLQLHEFFSRYGLLVGTNRLEQERRLTPKDHEVDYYIARYILEKKQDNAPEYRHILSLTKGYYLQTAIYLQPENGNLRSANYSTVDFYYDTPFLLDLLGYQSEEAENAAKMLHDMLRRQKAKCYYFPHIGNEITSILTAYQHTIVGENRTWRTLEGLDRKKYTYSAVERLKNTWPKTLEASFEIKLKNTPSYLTREGGIVDESDVLDEKEIRGKILEQAHHYSPDNLDRDMESVLAIHRLREGYDCTEIESSRAVLVTNNYDLAKAFNRYYRLNVDSRAFSPVITASELSAIAWVKSGAVGDIPEIQLLVNAYTALQPIPELLERFSTVLDQMETEGKITGDVALAMRTNHYVKRELWKDSFGDESAITERTILSAKDKYDEQVIQEQIQSANIKTKKRQSELYERAESLAIKAGREEKQHLISKLQIVVRVLFVVVMLISLMIAYLSRGNAKITIAGIVVALFNILGIYDSLKARKHVLSKLIIHIANQYETKVIEKKRVEYLKLVDEKKD